MSESMEYYRNDLPQCELYTWQDEMAAENAVNYLKKAGEKDERPFFLAVGFGCTHREYPRVPDEYETDYVVPKALPNLPDVRKDMAGMQIAVDTVDRLCGKYWML